MRFNRREFIQLTASGAAASVMPSPLLAESNTKIRVVLFDAFTIFDPLTVDVVAEELYPGRGKDLATLWRTRQFEYSWLRSITKNYVSFWQVTEDALQWAAAFLKLELTTEKRKKLLDTFLHLKIYPEVITVLTGLKNGGLKLAYLTNFSVDMLQQMNKNAGLETLLGNSITTDPYKLYKPDPRAYHLGMEVFNTQREEIAFAAFGGWDVAGSKWFGYQTFWVNHMHVPQEELGVEADAVGESLNDLATWLKPKI